VESADAAPDSVTTTPEKSVPTWKPETAPAESVAVPAIVPREMARVVVPRATASPGPTTASVLAPSQPGREKRRT